MSHAIFCLFLFMEVASSYFSSMSHAIHSKFSKDVKQHMNFSHIRFSLPSIIIYKRSF